MQKQRSDAPIIQFFPIALNESFPISVFHYTQKKKDLKKLHYHRSFEIGLCLEGSGIFFIENRPYSFRVDDVSFIYPNQPHIAQSPNEVPSRWIFIDVDIDQMLAGNKPLLNRIWDAAESVPRIIHHHQSESLNSVIKLIIFELENPKTECQGIVQNMLSILLLLVLETNSDHDDVVPAMTSNFTSISPALTLIAQKYSQEIYVSELAKTCNLSETHFRVLFKSTTGKTPQHYLAFVRLKMARALLRSTDMNILTVANSVGYNSVSSFNRLFKDALGCSPTQYRRNIL